MNDLRKMKYLVNFVKYYNKEQKFNAASKAREDIIKTFSTGDRKVFNLKRKSFLIWGKEIRKLPLIGIILSAINFALRVKKKDEIYFQYPFRDNSFKYIFKIFQKRGLKLNLIIHDIESFRVLNNPQKRKDEITILNNMSTLYVHTPAMKKLLQDNGVKVPMKCIYLFDYYSDDSMIPIDRRKTMKNIIAFAGNLNKSIFLYELNKEVFNNISYNLYGLLDDTNAFNNVNINYWGKFQAEKTGVLKAGWGLVWDGPSIKSCEGVYGDYLRYNSSHKISLYLACGIPLILWSQSSLAQWASQKGICITVDSLTDIEYAINQISDMEYENILANTQSVGEDLRKGNYLLYAINS